MSKNILKLCIFDHSCNFCTIALFGRGFFCRYSQYFREKWRGGADLVCGNPPTPLCITALRAGTARFQARNTRSGYILFMGCSISSSRSKRSLTFLRSCMMIIV